MCEFITPTVPVGGMGEITFPNDGNYGSGDIILPNKVKCNKIKRKIKKKVYTQKPANKILSFEEFYQSRN